MQTVEKGEERRWGNQEGHHHGSQCSGEVIPSGASQGKRWAQSEKYFAESALRDGAANGPPAPPRLDTAFLCPLQPTHIPKNKVTRIPLEQAGTSPAAFTCS